MPRSLRHLGFYVASWRRDFSWWLCVPNSVKQGCDEQIILRESFDRLECRSSQLFNCQSLIHSSIQSLLHSFLPSFKNSFNLSLFRDYLAFNRPMVTIGTYIPIYLPTFSRYSTLHWKLYVPLKFLKSCHQIIHGLFIFYLIINYQ